MEYTGNKEAAHQGLCACGCGQKTNLAPYNDKSRGWIKGEPLKFVKHHHAKGIKHHNWNGGKTNSHGYSLIKKEGHPRANRDGYVREHILIGEKALGKALPPNAVVHHANGTRNSGPLVICEDDNYHRFIEQRTRAYKACGHANWRKCKYCQTYDDSKNLYISPNNKNVRHNGCRNQHEKTLRSHNAPI